MKSLRGEGRRRADGAREGTAARSAPSADGLVVGVPRPKQSPRRAQAALASRRVAQQSGPVGDRAAGASRTSAGQGMRVRGGSVGLRLRRASWSRFCEGVPHCQGRCVEVDVGPAQSHLAAPPGGRRPVSRSPPRTTRAESIALDRVEESRHLVHGQRGDHVTWSTRHGASTSIAKLRATWPDLSDSAC